jgi:hypothetical protein
LIDLDIQRERWTAFRKPLGLVDIESENFGRGGLADRVLDPGVRLLILPADPSDMIVRFDSALWEWWNEEREGPFEAYQTSWGVETTPTVEAAVTFSRTGDSKWDGWNHFLALHRNGALEAALGGLAANSWAEHDQEQRAFSLVEIVGRAWVMFALYASVIERFKASGPWEVSVALVNTQNAQLGNVATGWRDIDDWRQRAPRCPERNIMIHREFTSWPDESGQQALAFFVGEQIEDAWGSTDRRFLIAPGREGEGKFDASRYRGSGW